MRPRFIQLGKDTFFYSAGLILRRGLSLITLPIFSRYLTQPEFGALAVLGTLRDLLTVAFELGTPNSSVRFYYDCKSPEERHRLFGTLFVFITAASIFLTLLVILAGPPLWQRIAPDVPFHPLVSLTALTVCLSGASILPRGLFRVTSRTPLFMTLGIIQGVLTAGLSIALVVVWHLGVLGAVVGNLIGAAIFVPVSWVNLRGHMTWAFSPRIVLRALAFGGPDVPVRVGMWTLKLADRLILQAYVPLALVGVYSLGYMLGATAFELVGSSLNAAILPFFYATATEEPGQPSRRVFASVAAYEGAVIAFLGLGTILFARDLIVLLATSRYLAAAPVVPIVVWGAVFLNLSHVPMRAIYNVKKTGWLVVVFVIPALLNIGLNLLWIPPYGIMGAAWATLVAYAVLLVLHFIVAQHVYPIPYQYGRMAMPLVLMLGLSVATGAVPPGPTLLALGSKALLLAAFPPLLWVCGFFTSEERRVLRQFVLRVLRPRGRPEVSGRSHAGESIRNGSVPDRRGIEAPAKGEEQTSAQPRSITSRMRAATPPVGDKL
jgi:O-antigen/teichoic acid export membrane protein